MEAVDATGEEHVAMYIPVYDEAEFFVYYFSYGGKVTEEEHDMIVTILLNMK